MERIDFTKYTEEKSGTMISLWKDSVRTVVKLYCGSCPKSR